MSWIAVMKGRPYLHSCSLYFFPKVSLYISSSFFLIYDGWGLVLGFWVDGGLGPVL